MTIKLTLKVQHASGTSEQTAQIDDLVIAGWAGRDKAAIEHHIAELEAVGVKRPQSTPTFYRVSASRLTCASSVEVMGSESSGEAEAVIFAIHGKLFVGVGSDHTDRDVETYSVAVSKQMCDKPIADTVWPYEEVADHWDQLVLRSYIVSTGVRTLYQEGAVAELLPPEALISTYTSHSGLSDGTAMFCGTAPAIGGIRAAARFEGELSDPVLGRTIRFGYDMKVLPAVY